MKIFFPITKFYPHSGGGPSFTVYWLAKELAKTGHEVTVVSTNKGLNNHFPANRWNNVDGIKVKYCTYWLEKLPVRMIWNSIKEVKNNDIIQFSSVSSLVAFIVALYAMFCKKVVLWSPRGEFADAALNDSTLKKLYFAVLKAVFKKYAVFHSTSDKETVEIKKILGECEIIQIPNYIELPPKRSCDVDKTLLYVGRINPIKSIHKLIEALNLSDIFMQSDYVLKLAGDVDEPTTRNYYNSLKHQIAELGLEDRVVFLGVVKDIAKIELYSRSYFSFLVSESENFGNVVIESLSQGTPVVASLGTPWSLLQSEKIGYHVSNDPLTLSKVIDEIIKMPNEEYQAMRLRAYAICRDYFSIEKNVDKWVDVYNKFIRR